MLNILRFDKSINLRKPLTDNPVYFLFFLILPVFLFYNIKAIKEQYQSNSEV